MSVISVIPPYSVFDDAEGESLESGYLYIGVANQNPLVSTNLVAVYADSALTIPVAQPVRTSGGYAFNNGSPIQLYVGAADYSIVILDKDGGLVSSSLTNKTKFGLIDLSTDVTGLLPSTAIKYDITPEEIAAGVTIVNYYKEPANVLRYKTNTTPGTTNMTAGFNAAWLAYKDIYAPAGNYLVDTIATPAPHQGRTLRGDGPLSTILTQSSANGDVIRLASDFSSQFLIEVKDLSIIGTGLGTGNGIHAPPNGGNPPFNFKLTRVFISGMGGRGIFDEGAFFTTVLENVLITACKDHQFDMNGGNSLTLINCYAAAVPTAGKAGFRIHAGNPTLIGCNGINSGEYWAIFGDTVVEDGTTGFCQATLIGCNIEDYGLVGIRQKNSFCRFLGTTFVAPAAGANLVAYQVGPANGVGFTDNVHSISATKGATFKNGVAIHVTNAQQPFGFATSASNTGVVNYSFYDDTGALAYTASSTGSELVVFSRIAQNFGDIWGKGIVKVTQGVDTPVTITYSAAMTPNAALGCYQVITVTNGVAFTINAPTNGVTGQYLEITIRNASGGAHGAITLTGYKAAAAPVIANGSSKTILFRFDGTNWVERCRSAVDIPN